MRLLHYFQILDHYMMRLGLEFVEKESKQNYFEVAILQNMLIYKVCTYPDVYLLICHGPGPPAK